MKLMNAQDQHRMEELCSRITIEKDPRKFLELVHELNELLEHSQRQLDKNRADAVRPDTPQGQPQNT